jgi:hypothetical protein
VSGLGFLLFEILSDLLPLFLVINICCLTAALSTLFQAFDINNAVIILFAIVFGLSSQSLTMLWSRKVTIIAGEGLDSQKARAAARPAADDANLPHYI